MRTNLLSSLQSKLCFLHTSSHLNRSFHSPRKRVSVRHFTEGYLSFLFRSQSARCARYRSVALRKVSVSLSDKSILRISSVEQLILNDARELFEIRSIRLLRRDFCSVTRSNRRIDERKGRLILFSAPEESDATLAVSEHWISGSEQQWDSHWHLWCTQWKGEGEIHRSHQSKSIGLQSTTTCTDLLQTKVPIFQESDFSVSRQHEEFIWLHDRYNENEEYAGLIVSGRSC